MELRLSRRAVLGGATGIALTGALSACTGNGSPSASSSTSGLPDLTGKREAAMDNYVAGQQFKATAPIKISTLFSDHPNYPYRADWLLWSEIQKRCNVTFEVTTVPMSDYPQKRSLVVSAGDAPFIIPKTYPGQEVAFVSSGAILPVSDYISLMPNFQQKVADWKMEPELNTLRQSDGKFYVLPGLHEELWPDYTLIYRFDTLEQLGIAEPQTWDDVHAAFKTIKSATGAKYVLSDRYQGKNLLNLCATAFGTTAGWGVIGPVYNKASDKFEYGPTTQNFKDFVSFLTQMVSEGLVDPSSFTQQDDAAISAFGNGQTYAISGNSQDPSQHRKLLDKSLGSGNYRIAKGILPGGPAGMIMGGNRLENGIMITANALKSPNFVAMMQFIDWLWYSDAGEEFAKWGVEGVTFNKDASGKRTLAPDVDYIGLNPAGTKKLNVDFGFSGGNFAYGGSTELIQSMMAEEEKQWQQRMAAERKQVELPPPYPFTDVEREQATLLSTPLQDYSDQNTLKFITGQRPLNEWDAFLKELQAKSLGQYMDMVNKAYQRYKTTK
jgi:putative aldouronate transport system substrate-binding protein